MVVGAAQDSLVVTIYASAKGNADLGHATTLRTTYKTLDVPHH